jgi:alanyl-tRNA synthetase
MIRSEEVRKLFLNFFEKRGHKIVPSSSLIPYDDPSVLLTTAGMQQFKKYYTREKDPNRDFGTQRTASIQKCFRTTDIDEVGDERHLTFFEMLGNFSFGPVSSDDPQDFGTSGYFKRSSIYWAYEFLTKELSLNIDYVTIFGGEKDVPLDETSLKIWQEIGINKIEKRGREDNFWGPTGDEGPCGPTTEIYLEGIEVWNLVFNEYYQDKNKKLKKLEFPGVDTGMGFERLMKVLQKTETIFETDLFMPLFEVLEEIPGEIRRKRIVMDHIRGSVFLVADGLYPSNLERGYILRRILRRILLHSKFLNLSFEKIEEMIKKVIEKYKEFYPELQNFEKIKKVIFDELNTFEETLKNGLREFEKKVKESDSDEVLGEKVFYLYTSYGLPYEISKELLKERGIIFSERAEKVFKELFEKHRQISKGENNG